MAWNWQEIKCMMIINCLLLPNYVGECRFLWKDFYKTLAYVMQNIMKILVTWSSKEDEKKKEVKSKENKPFFPLDSWFACISGIGLALLWQQKAIYSSFGLPKPNSNFSSTLLSIPMAAPYAFIYWFCSMVISIIQRWTRQFSCIDVFFEFELWRRIIWKSNQHAYALLKVNSEW